MIGMRASNRGFLILLWTAARAKTRLCGAASRHACGASARTLLPALLAAGLVLGAPGVSDAQLLSDSTGLVNRIEIAAAGGQTFEVVITSNFDIVGYEFAAADKKLVLQTGGVLSENIAEIVVPAGLLSGQLGASVDGLPVDAQVRSTDTISFLVLVFEGGGGGGDAKDGPDRAGRTIEITGTKTSVSETAGVLPPDGQGGGGVSGGGGADAGSVGHDSGGGCLVATATFGSELDQRVQLLREVRDSKVSSTESGRAFMDAFNSAYYSFSPHVADYMRENPSFADAARVLLTPMLLSLEIMNHAEAGSEVQVLAYGSLLILLNVGVYAAVPAAVLAAVFTRLQSCLPSSTSPHAAARAVLRTRGSK